MTAHTDLTAELTRMQAAVNAAVTEYNALVTSESSAKSALAAAQAQVVTLTAQVADLKAQIAALQPPPPTGVVPAPAGSVAYGSLPGNNFTEKVRGAASVYLPVGTYEFTDFAVTTYGAVVGAPNLTLSGAGASTVLRMKAGTSTKKAAVAALVKPNTNPYRVIQFGYNTTGQAVAQDFTIEGTEQGHLYGGLDMMKSASPIVRRVKIFGIPGGAGYPPFETFSGNMWRCTDGLFDTCEFSGLRPGSTVKWASSLLGLNNADRTTIRGCNLHHAQAMGIAAWQSVGGTIIDTKIDNVWRPINLERCSGVWNITRVTIGTWDPTASGMVMVESDLGNAQVTITDPVFTGPKFVVCVPSSYNGVANTQNKADVKLVIGGVSRPDLLAIV